MLPVLEADGTVEGKERMVVSRTLRVSLTHTHSLICGPYFLRDQVQVDFRVPRAAASLFHHHQVGSRILKVRMGSVLLLPVMIIKKTKGRERRGIGRKSRCFWTRSDERVHSERARHLASPGHQSTIRQPLCSVWVFEQRGSRVQTSQSKGS